MPVPYDVAVSGLNAGIMAAFGRRLVLVSPEGVAFDVIGDWRQEPVLIDTGAHGAVSSYQVVVGFGRAALPPDVDAALADDWDGWSVVVPAATATTDIPAGSWSVVDLRRPGGGWLDLALTNHRPPP